MAGLKRVRCGVEGSGARHTGLGLFLNTSRSYGSWAGRVGVVVAL